MGLQPLAFFLGLPAGLIEFTAQLGSGLAVTLGRLVGSALRGPGGSGLELGRIGVLVCLVNFGVALREFISVFGLSLCQLLLRPRYRGVGLGATVGDPGLHLFAHARRFGDRIFDERIGFFTFTFGGLCALIGQARGPLSGCATSLGLGHLGERVAVCILNLRTRSLDVASRPELDHQVVEVPPQVCHFPW
ncbi:hypothetical protein [Mycobacterium riyadhense]|uniref:Uncharacterized protein n=1 Tax=Mycobacterium riyadhense TaxID=486698 RepID=A0A1X2B411_9MYCO|nr:hypothetical protein [Mycobacterium riyadhense]MCV7148334.1 hypothetical protein [Mycobacterium riyadhense]ORW58287.1 hypothetical protein AWC22_06490 [Mycobacterium riyadhense]